MMETTKSIRDFHLEALQLRETLLRRETMAQVDFGWVVPAGPNKDNLAGYLHDLDANLPNVEKYFKSLWMTDHFQWNDKPTYEAWIVMTYLAAKYPQFEIGPMVLGQSYRNPAMLAKMAATLQTLSDGKFIMAIGAGWKEDEYHAYGYDYPRPGIRVEQLEDTLEIMTRLWKESGQVTYEGKHYQVKDAWCEPKPDPIPPIIVGGGGKKVMMLAARFADWWSIPDAKVDVYKERVEILKQHCETIGRDPATMRLTWFGRLAVHKTQAEAEALSDGKWTSERAIVGTPQQAIDLLNGFTEAGCDYFMVEPLGTDDPEIASLVFDEVLPAVTG